MSLSLKGSSRSSLVTTRAQLEKLVSQLDAPAAAQVSSELLSIVTVLDSSIALRRALSDFARDEASKVALSKQVFTAISNGHAFTVLATMVGLRWSSPRDIGDVLELLGVETLSVAVEKAAQLEQLESELFAFAQIVSKNPELRATFALRSASEVKKSDLVSALLSGKALQASIDLISFLVDHPRGRNLESGLNEFADIISTRKARMIAHVVSASALSPDQVSRLTGALTKMLGHEIRVNVSIEKEVVGGLSIRIADELIDGTVIARLAQADRLLAGKSA
ncbi:MAG: F0F1 ATP synthase subunit delta [Streptomycetaceae bacterium]|jgi:F-type H+-transporting ATPase subunit delta|nr:MAG: F0F1 ATP synthase subunit delta [Streptomycetaceae bacterium]